MEQRVAYSRSSGGMKRVLPAQVEEGLQCACIALPPLGCRLQNTPQTGDLRATRFKSPGMALWPVRGCGQCRSSSVGIRARRLRERSEAPT